MSRPKRCRHDSHSWLLAGGYWEWCYQCGAVRKLIPLERTANTLMPTTQWLRPTGENGKNPWPMKELKR